MDSVLGELHSAYCAPDRGGTNVPNMTTRASTIGPFDEAASAALRAAAAEHRVTQVEVAAKTGIPHRTLIRYWNAQSTIPIGKLVEIAAAIGVSAADIIEAAQVIVRRAENHSGR